MKHTSLYDCHIRDASEVINLKGVARAMQYQGHAAEHQATREGVTLCDVSHMGEIDFEAKGGVTPSRHPPGRSAPVRDCT